MARFHLRFSRRLYELIGEDFPVKCQARKDYRVKKRPVPSRSVFKVCFCNYKVSK